MLKDIDEDYRTTLIDFSKYKLIILAMAKLILISTENVGVHIEFTI